MTPFSRLSGPAPYAGKGGNTMFDAFNDIVIWSFHNSRITYAIIVVIVMAVLGSVIGICADFFIRALGINLDKYTDSHI